MDLFLVNYYQNESHVSTAASVIHDYKFNYDSVNLLVGTNKEKTLTYEELCKRWRDLYLQFYTHYGESVGVITFPEIIECDEKESVGTNPWEKNMTLLKEWCKKSNLKCGLIIRNYDLKGHLNFSKIEIDVNENFGQCSERLLLFNPSQRVILVIYCVENAETLEVDVFNCIDEVNMLGLLLKDDLKFSGVIVTGIVACSGKVTHHCSKNCRNFIVSDDIFASVNKFSNFWDDYNFQKLCQERPTVQEYSDKQIFQAIASKILGFLAHFQFTISDKASLPTLKKSPEKNILETELLLNRYQMSIIYSNKKRVLLSGTYGTGKSVVIYKKIELLEKSLKDKEVIYYVNFEGKSALNSDFRVKMKPSDKVKVIRSDLNLSTIITSQILKNEEKNGTRNIHLMVDEYNTESLSREEASSLSNVIKNQAQFKNSTIYIAQQPIKISRVEYREVYGQIGETIVREHKLDELKEIMFECKLTYVMRMTKQIFELVATTQLILEGKSNLCTRERQSNQDYAFNLPKLNIMKEMTITKPICQPDAQQRFDPDLFYEHLDSEVYEIDFQKFEDTYRFDLGLNIGHDIDGPLPQLIKVPESSDRFEKMALIAFFLKEILKIHEKRVAMLYFELETPAWLKKLLQIEAFLGLNVTFDAEKFQDADTRNKDLVLVTDYRFVRGLEFSYVLLLLNVNQYHTKQFIPEAMARCMSNLLIILLPCEKTFNRNGTVLDLVGEWKKNNTHKKGPILEIVELDLCHEEICCVRNHSGYCKDGSNILVQSCSKLYRNLYEEIKDHGVPKFQSDDQKKKTKVTTL